MAGTVDDLLECITGSCWCQARSTGRGSSKALSPVPLGLRAPSDALRADAAPQLSHPSISGDGKKIALQATLKGNSQIITVALDGSKLSFVGEGESPEWSPDGKRVAFVRQVNGFRQVFLANADGTNVIQVTSDPSDSEAPT